MSSSIPTVKIILITSTHKNKVFIRKLFGEGKLNSKKFFGIEETILLKDNSTLDILSINPELYPSLDYVSIFENSNFIVICSELKGVLIRPMLLKFIKQFSNSPIFQSFGSVGTNFVTFENFEKEECVWGKYKYEKKLIDTIEKHIKSRTI